MEKRNRMNHHRCLGLMAVASLFLLAACNLEVVPAEAPANQPTFDPWPGWQGEIFAKGDQVAFPATD